MWYKGGHTNDACSKGGRHAGCKGQREGAAFPNLISPAGFPVLGFFVFGRGKSDASGHNHPTVKLFIRDKKRHGEGRAFRRVAPWVSSRCYERAEKKPGQEIGEAVRPSETGQAQTQNSSPEQTRHDGDFTVVTEPRPAAGVTGRRKSVPGIIP